MNEPKSFLELLRHYDLKGCEKCNCGPKCRMKDYLICTYHVGFMPDGSRMEIGVLISPN